MSETIHPIQDHVSDFLKGSQLEKSADGWEIPTCCLQLIGGLLGWFFQKSHVDECSHHASLCAFSKSLCSWSTIKWLIGLSEIFCRSPPWGKTGHLYKARENYIIGLVVIMWTWDLVHLWTHGIESIYQSFSELRIGWWREYLDSFPGPIIYLLPRWFWALQWTSLNYSFL